MSLKSVAKQLVPPIILQSLMRLRSNRGITFEGDYSSWQAALDAAGGYDAPVILERVRAAALRVKQGGAVFERDSVCFDHEEYRWPTLACLLRVAAEHEGVFRVLDFGGSLGSFYFQHRKHFLHLKQIRWSVVEQSHYVACGRANLQDEVLRFYESLDECLAEGGVDIIFCSSVLQYLQTPYAILTELSRCGTQYILIDRTPFIAGERDRLTVQHVPPSIYSASYPAWFFSSKRFLEEVNHAGFQIDIEFPGEDEAGIGAYKGMLLERK